MKILFIGVAVVLSAVTVYADYLIKKASLAPSWSAWQTLLLGMGVYALTGLGWFYTMRHIKLSTLGVVYGVSCIVMLAAVSVFVFKEKMRPLEILGMALALIAIVLMARFA